MELSHSGEVAEDEHQEKLFPTPKSPVSPGDGRDIGDMEIPVSSETQGGVGLNCIIIHYYIIYILCL